MHLQFISGSPAPNSMLLLLQKFTHVHELEILHPGAAECTGWPLRTLLVFGVWTPAEKAVNEAEMVGEDEWDREMFLFKNKTKKKKRSFKTFRENLLPFLLSFCLIGSSQCIPFKYLHTDLVNLRFCAVEYCVAVWFLLEMSLPLRGE